MTLHVSRARCGSVVRAAAASALVAGLSVTVVTAQEAARLPAAPPAQAPRRATSAAYVSPEVAADESVRICAACAGRAMAAATSRVLHQTPSR
jgi:hypothetical protein